MGQPFCIARMTLGLDGMGVFDGRVAADASAINRHKIAVVIVETDTSDLNFMNSSPLVLDSGDAFQAERSGAWCNAIISKYRERARVFRLRAGSSDI